MILVHSPVLTGLPPLPSHPQAATLAESSALCPPEILDAFIVHSSILLASGEVSSVRREAVDRLKVIEEVGMRGDPQTCWRTGLHLQVSARGEAAAVPPRGPRWRQELHLFIIAIYIVSGICRRLQQPHILIRPCRALGARGLQDSRVDPGLESLRAPT